MAGRLGRRRRSVVTIVAIVAYVAFAGASPSVVRAALMAGVVLLARESGRAGRAAAALGWAATLLLLTDPSLIGDAGFQLSSLATAGLIAWATPLTDVDRVDRARAAPALARREPRRVAGGTGGDAADHPRVVRSAGDPVAARQPRRRPARRARRWRPASSRWRAALAVVAGAPAILGAVVAAPGWVILRILVADRPDDAPSLPFASVTLEPPFDVAAAASRRRVSSAVTWWRAQAAGTAAHRAPPRASRRADRRRRAEGARSDPRTPVDRARRAGLAGTDRRRRGRRRRRRRPPTASPRVSILDVGQGDAILVEGSRGGRLLVDGGPDPDRLLVALDRRIPPWDRRIDAVILSHPHEDHVAGLALLLERYHVDRVFEPGMRGPGPGYAAWLRELAGPGRTDPAQPRRRRPARRRRDRPPTCSGRFAGRSRREPPDGGTGINNVSVVLLGQVGPRRFLLMGDVEEEIDPSLLAEGLPHVDLLKVAHHGSRTATTQAFVDVVRPRSPSRRPVPGTRTGTRPGRRSTVSRRRARACSGRIATARSSSASRPTG